MHETEKRRIVWFSFLFSLCLSFDVVGRSRCCCLWSQTLYRARAACILLSMWNRLVTLVFVCFMRSQHRNWRTSIHRYQYFREHSMNDLQYKMYTRNYTDFAIIFNKFYHHILSSLTLNSFNCMNVRWPLLLLFFCFQFISITLYVCVCM